MNLGAFCRACKGSLASGVSCATLALTDCLGSNFFRSGVSSIGPSSAAPTRLESAQVTRGEKLKHQWEG